jgi:hypothetical protein
MCRYQRGNQAVNQRRTDKTMANRTNNDIQNTTQKTKDGATQTQERICHSGAALAYDWFSSVN